MSMPFDRPDIYDPPVLFLTDWEEEDCISTSIYEESDHRAGEVWRDEKGYHAVILSNTGEGAHIKGIRRIEDFIRKERK
jgi:hypothetical protein